MLDSCCFVPCINVVRDSSEPAPEGCRRPDSRRMAPECARSCREDEHCGVLIAVAKKFPPTKVACESRSGVAVARFRVSQGETCASQCHSLLGNTRATYSSCSSVNNSQFHNLVTPSRLSIAACQMCMEIEYSGAICPCRSSGMMRLRSLHHLLQDCWQVLVVYRLLPTFFVRLGQISIWRNRAAV